MVQLQSYHYLHLPLLSVYEDSLNCSVCHELKLLSGCQGSHVLHLVIQYAAPYSLIDVIVRNHKDGCSVVYNDILPLQIACGYSKKSWNDFKILELWYGLGKCHYNYKQDEGIFKTAINHKNKTCWNSKAETFLTSQLQDVSIDACSTTAKYAHIDNRLTLCWLWGVGVHCKLPIQIYILFVINSF